MQKGIHMNLPIERVVLFCEHGIWKAAVIGLLISMSFVLLASEGPPLTAKVSETVREKADGATSTTEVAIEAAENDEDEQGRKDCPYLGIATTEASEALAAQL